METATTTPKVWAGCLAAYNDGELHGDWMDATDADELRESIETMLKASPVPNAEEFHFCDWEGFGEASSGLDRYSSIDSVCAVGALIEEHGDRAQAWLSEPYNFDNPEEFENICVEEFEDVGDWEYDFFESCFGDPDKILEPYGLSSSDIDWERKGEDRLQGYGGPVRINGTSYVWSEA